MYYIPKNVGSGCFGCSVDLNPSKKRSKARIPPGPPGDRWGLVDELTVYGYNSGYIFGPIAQLGARLNGIEKAEGSNPSGSTLKVLAGVLSHPSASRESEV